LFCRVYEKRPVDIVGVSVDMVGFPVDIVGFSLSDS
jgi:hypothetical protein